MKKKIVFAGMILAILISGCGKNKDNGKNENATNDTSFISSTTEEVTTEEEATTEEITLDMNDYLADDEYKLYSMKMPAGDMSDVISVAMYDDEHIVMLCLGENRELTVKLMSLRSGKVVEACTVSMDEPKEYWVDDSYSFNIVSVNPLVVYRSSAEELLVFREDFSECTVMNMQNKNNTISAACEDNYLYYQNSGDLKIYRYDMSDITASKDGEKTDLLYGMPEQGKINSNVIEVAYNTGELIWRPDVNMANCSIEGIDDDEIYLNIYDIVNDLYFYAAYDMEDKEYDEMYTVEDYFEMYDGDFDWTLSTCYEADQEGYTGNDAGRQGVVYCDYENDRKYLAYVPDAQNDNYSWCKLGFRDDEDDRYLLIYMVTLDFDEGEACDSASEEEYDGECGVTSEYVCDILLWDYKNSSYTECRDDIKSDYMMDDQIEYGEATERARELEEKYDVQVVLGANVKGQFPDYDAEVCEDTQLMISAMDEIDAALSIFPEGFIDELTSECYICITFYLTGTLTSKDTDTYIGQAGAVTSATWGYQMIALDINEWNIKGTIVHELCHAIDNKLGVTGDVDALNEAWSEYNPEGFSYYNSYIGYEGDFEDTTYAGTYYDDMDAEKVYFYDDYAKTFPGEDRARTMEHFVEWENLESCYNSSHLQGKLKVFLDYLYDNFESIRNADSFQWQETYDKLIADGTAY